MKTFIFYTPEGNTYSPENKLCENFQILGFEEDISQQCALQKFLLQNSWVSEYGFSIEKIMIKQVF